MAAGSWANSHWPKTIVSSFDLSSNVRMLELPGAIFVNLVRLQNFMKNDIFMKKFTFVFLAFLSATTAVQAQESANAELDACVRDEQITLTAKGAGLGALAGLSAGLFSGNKDNTVKKAAIGAAVGGAAGFATAYFTAIDTCFKKNPSWIPESKIERTQDYTEAKNAANYKPSQGIKVEAIKLVMPSTAKAGATLDAASSFYVLTPDGAETEVTIERKLFSIVDGNETQVTFNGKTTEQSIMQPGRHSDIARLPIPAKAQAGTKYRIEFSVSAGGKPPSTVQATVTVE